MKVKKIYNYIMSSDKQFGYRVNLNKIEQKVSVKGLDQWYVDMINHQRDLQPSSGWVIAKKQYPGDVNTWLSS